MAKRVSPPDEGDNSKPAWFAMEQPRLTAATLEIVAYENDKLDRFRPAITLTIRLDEQIYSGFQFWRDQAGKAKIAEPTVSHRMSTAGKFRCADKIREILENWAEEILPPVKPLGLDRSTNTIIHHGSQELPNPVYVAKARKLLRDTRFYWVADE